MKSFFSPLLRTLFIWLLVAQCFADIPVSIFPTKAQIGETIRFTLKLINNQARQLPDLSPLQQDFSIVGSENKQSYTLINGTSSSINEWTVLLVAKKEGLLTIPSLNFGSESTKPLQIEVGPSVLKNSKEKSSEDKEIFIESEISDNTPYVNQELIYTVKIFIKHQLMDAEYIPPKVENALLITLGKGQQYAMTINDEHYSVSEQKYAIFPQKSGEFTITAPEFIGLIYKTLPEKIISKGESLRLQVKPQPSLYTPQTWLPAKEVTLKEDYDPNKDAFEEGATFTRTITIKAVGIPAQLIPSLPLESTDSLTVYPEKIGETNNSDASDIIGTTTVKASYLLNKAGKIIIPELKITWFNISKGKEEQAILPQRVLEVAAVTANSPGISPPSEKKIKSVNPSIVKSSSKPLIQYKVIEKTSWLPWILTISFALLWFVTLFYFFIRRGGASYKNLLKQLKEACLSNNGPLAKERIIRWAKWQWKNADINDLEDIGRLTEDMALKRALNDLAVALYHKEPTLWQGEDLWKAVSRHSWMPDKKKRNKVFLPSLYRIGQ